MNGRWFVRLSLEVICAFYAVYGGVRVVMDLVSLHLAWALVWAALSGANVLAFRVHRGERRRIEARLDREARRG